MAGIEAMTRELVKTYSCISEDKQKLFQAERVAIGTCPPLRRGRLRGQEKLLLWKPGLSICHVEE